MSTAALYFSTSPTARRDAKAALAGGHEVFVAGFEVPGAHAVGAGWGEAVREALRLSRLNARLAGGVANGRKVLVAVNQQVRAAASPGRPARGGGSPTSRLAAPPALCRSATRRTCCRA